MNKIFKIALAILAIFIADACSPDEFELGKVDVTGAELVPGIAYRIEHDNSNPNIIYLRSLMGTAYTPLWDHPQGRSQEQTVTLKIPFPGTYTVKFGVQTRGGIVYGEPTTFEVEDFHAPFVEDELWTLLSGGVGNEKVWYLDLDGDALSRYFLGPLYFYGTDNGWQGACMEDGGDCWNWNPDYKGNSWLMSSANFGSMTFDLKGAANVEVVHNTISGRGTETGTYLLDAEAKTLRMTDASPLHDSGRDGVVIDWGNIKILSLTSDHMQLAVLRDPVLSGEGACLLVYNYISKDYFDNWVPGDLPDPEPPYDGDPNTDLTTTTKKTWGLSLNTPYNWTNLEGAFLNNWISPADYTATGWAPYDATMISKVSLTLDKTGATAGDYTFTDGSGAEISGTYSIDATNNITFDKSISFAISGWASISTTSEKKLRVISTEKDAFGNITKLWLGQRDPTKDEYMVYGFEPRGAAPADPAAAWKNALAGKTFKPDVNWFINWVGFPPAFSGGWTSASTFGNDFTSNGWVWDANVRAVAESARLAFRLEGNNLKLDLTQTKNGVAFSATGDVTIDPVTNILNISIPLVDYVGTAAAWLSTTNTKSITGSTNDWYFVPHGGASLATISTNGIWLGVVSQSTAAGDANDEVLIFHYILQ
jgi:hypothetical protein